MGGLTLKDQPGLVHWLGLAVLVFRFEAELGLIVQVDSFAFGLWWWWRFARVLFVYREGVLASRRWWRLFFRVGIARLRSGG
jgi:hypothetical protein